MSDMRAEQVRAFQESFRGADDASAAVRVQLARLFPKRASGVLPSAVDESPEEVEERLRDLGELVRDSDVLGAVPAALRELATFMISEDYVAGTRATGMENQSLYGVYDFDEVNGPDGILGAMKDSGDAPAGVFCIGENVFVDTRGEIGSRDPGAVYKAYGFALDGAEPCAPSLAAFLEKCGP
jgi:hypothetical protein